VPNSDDTITETSEQLLTESVPGKRSTLGKSLLGGGGSLGSGGGSSISLILSFKNGNGLVGSTHEVVYLNGVFSTDGNPLELGVEGDLIDG